MLGASQSRPSPSGPAFAEAVVVSAARRDVAASRQALPAEGEVWGGEKRRLGVGVRSALRDLTRRDCLSAVNEVNEASFATRPRAEHHSEVGAQRRPPQSEPPAGSAWRDARRSRASTGFLSLVDSAEHCTFIPDSMKQESGHSDPRTRRLVRRPAAAVRATRAAASAPRRRGVRRACGTPSRRSCVSAAGG